MKIATAPQDVSVNGNFVTSDFNVGDVAFIVDMFADKVYTHKERAVIRELACNAHDSHVMAGTEDIPFRVHLPTTLEPWFSVRDFGTGLSDYDVRNTFAGIGISTKRNNNNVIGCFGIGSLSPYSLADSFTVISYYNGTMRSYTCYRDELRKPVVALLAESETDEPNGLEVSVSVNGKVGRFQDEAEYVFRFWEGTLPLINDNHVVQQSERQRKSYTFQTDDFGLSAKWGEMYAIMGNIAYKIPCELDEIRCEGYIKFKLGELEFDTARENLSMTDKVRQAISAKMKSVKASLYDIATNKIEELPTAFDKAVMAEKLSHGMIGNILSKANLNKYALPQPKESFTYWQAKRRGCENNNSKHVPVGDSIEYYLYKERMSGRIKSYLKEKDSGYTLVIFKDANQAAECLVPHHMLRDLNDLPKVEYTRNCSGSSNTVKTYEFKVDSYNYSPAGSWRDAVIDINSDEIVYVELNRYNPVGGDDRISGSTHTIRSTINRMKSCGIKCPQLIGLKSVYLKSKQFKDGNFIHFDKYVEREFKKIIPESVVGYNDSDMGFCHELSKYIDHVDLQNIVSYMHDSKVIDVCTNMGWIDIESVQVDKTAQELMDSFFGKYFMLRLLESWEIGRKREILAKYIDGNLKAS